MNNNDFNNLANDLLTCYFTDAGAEELLKIANKYGVPITGKVFKKATERTIKWLETSNSESYDLLNETNKSHVFQMGLKGISDKFGATLGKDFSMAPGGGLLINNELMGRIVADLPPEIRKEFEREGMVKSMTQDPFKMLDESLGVPFFTKLAAIVKLRVQTLSDEQASIYLCGIAGGMQHKHNWISDEWVVRFFYNSLGKDRFEVFRKMEDVPEDIDAQVLVFDDLLTALGRTERKLLDDGTAVMYREDMLALDKVFRGEKFSLAELAEQCRRMEEKYRKDNPNV
jgi:hypothetical protein